LVATNFGYLQLGIWQQGASALHGTVMPMEIVILHLSNTPMYTLPHLHWVVLVVVLEAAIHLLLLVVVVC